MPQSTRSEGDSPTDRSLALIAAGGSMTLATSVAARPDMIRDPADVVVVLAGVAAAVLGGWWLANVVAWSAALRTGGRVQRFTLPGTKRLAQVLLAASLSGACVAETSEGPAMILIESSAVDGTGPTSTEPPTTEPPTTEPSSGGVMTPVDTARLDDPVRDDPVPVDAAATGADATPGANPPSIPAHQVIVTRGDNLWSLSAEALERHGVPEPTCATIAQYWRLVVAANQVRSGDPDLIVPGETIDLPAHEFAG